MIEYLRVNALCQMLDRYKEIIIYGAGNYAKAIYPLLVEHNLKQKILCFTQTEEGETKSIDKLPIISFGLLNTNKNLDKNNCAVLVAVSQQYSNDIKQTLIQHKYTNVFVMEDYRKHTESDFDSLSTFEEYCDYMVDWYLEARTDRKEKKAVVQELLERGKNAGEKTDSGLIVVICGHMTARSNKIIGALIRKKYRVIMLRYNFLNYNTCCCMKELESLNIQIIECSCIEEMLYEALQYDPLVYFFEPRWAECSWAKIMIKNKKYFGKIVLALYDVLNGCMLDQPQRRMDSEKYALENADGIVWRWFSKEYLETKGFVFKGKSIQFLDYCSKTVSSVVKSDSEHSVVKICNVSGVADCYVEERLHSLQYLDYARVGEVLEKIGNRNDCVFHFYASHLKEENIKKCKYYEKIYRNFKFFVGTEHDELLTRIKQYDYGCDLYTDGEWPSDDTPVGNVTGSIRKYSTRNILFDYLSAGLPIITTTPLKLLDYLRPYDVVIKMNLSALDIDFLKQNKEYYRKKVEAANEKLDVDVQISRLIKFFKTL